MKTSLKNKRLNIDESIALIKDDKTGKKNWRHRFMKKSGVRATLMQDHKDYPGKKFTTLDEFEEYILASKK